MSAPASTIRPRRRRRRARLPGSGSRRRSSPSAVETLAPVSMAARQLHPGRRRRRGAEPRGDGRRPRPTTSCSSVRHRPAVRVGTVVPSHETIARAPAARLRELLRLDDPGARLAGDEARARRAARDGIRRASRGPRRRTPRAPAACGDARSRDRRSWTISFAIERVVEVGDLVARAHARVHAHADPARLPVGRDPPGRRAGTRARRPRR